MLCSRKGFDFKLSMVKIYTKQFQNILLLYKLNFGSRDEFGRFKKKTFGEIFTFKRFVDSNTWEEYNCSNVWIHIVFGQNEM